MDLIEFEYLRSIWQIYEWNSGFSRAIMCDGLGEIYVHE